METDGSVGVACGPGAGAVSGDFAAPVSNARRKRRFYYFSVRCAAPPPECRRFLLLGGGVPVKVGNQAIGAVGIGGAPGGHLGHSAMVQLLSAAQRKRPRGS